MTERQSLTVLTTLFVLALIAYTLPWVVGKGAAMTYGAYDFAEWTSLHPASHAQNPTLLTPLLLRLPLALLVVALVFGTSYRASTRHRLFLGGLVIVTAIALFPPLEFMTVARDDPNFRQQAMLSGLTLIVGLVAVSGITRRVSRWIGAALALVAALAGLIGLAQGFALLQGFHVPVTLSAFGPLFAVLSVGTALITCLARPLDSSP